MPARLISLCGRPTIVLTKSLTLVGRQPSCDVRINSTRISRCHCCLLIENQDLVVRDLDSTNGTHVNGQSVTSGRLRHDDILTIGHLAYRVCLTVHEDDETSAKSENSTSAEPEPPTAIEESSPGTIGPGEFRAHPSE